MSSVAQKGPSVPFEGLSLETNTKAIVAILAVSSLALIALGIAGSITQVGIHGPGYSFSQFTSLDKAFYFTPPSLLIGGSSLLMIVNIQHHLEHKRKIEEKRENDNWML